MTTPVKFKGKNNGWGNGDQDAPGNSGPHNNAENSDRDPPPGIVKKFSSSSDEADTANHEALQEELSQIESSASPGKSNPSRRVK